METQLVLALCYLALLLFRAVLGSLSARGAPRPPGALGANHTTVVQPILSGDAQLEDTLENNLRELPTAHFLWLIDTEDAVGRDIAARLQRRHPLARINILLCPEVPPATNPKLFKLALAESALSTSTFVVLDDDTTLPAETLPHLQAALAAGAGVATGLPLYQPGRNIPSRLVEQFVNNESILTYLAWARLRTPITLNGMTYALSTRQWKATGGFASLVNHLTDDAAVAMHVRAAGQSIHQSAGFVLVSTSVRDFTHYRSLMHRWFLFAALLAHAQPVSVRALMGGLLALPCILLWSLVVIALVHHDAFSGGVLCLVLTVRSIVLMSTQRWLTGRSRHHLLYSLAAELLQPLHALHAFFVRTIHWRGRLIAVKSDTHFDYR